MMKSNINAKWTKCNQLEAVTKQVKLMFLGMPNKSQNLRLFLTSFKLNKKSCFSLLHYLQ